MTHLNETVCEKRTYSRDRYTHDHPYGQLLFPLSGSMHIETERQCVQLKGDSGFYLPPGCRHTFSASGRNEFLVLDIPVRFLYDTHRASEDGTHILLNERWKSVRYLLVEEANRNHAAPQRTREPRVSKTAALSHLVHYLTHFLSQPVSHSIRYIHDHYAEPLTVNMLAQLEHYHPTYYQQWFKKQTGMSPSAYIQRVRLEEAKRLLRETDWTITNIAVQVGYEYLPSFTRMFVRYEGQAPQAYRQTVKKG